MGSSESALDEEEMFEYQVGLSLVCVRLFRTEEYVMLAGTHRIKCSRNQSVGNYVQFMMHNGNPYTLQCLQEVSCH